MTDDVAQADEPAPLDERAHEQALRRSRRVWQLAMGAVVLTVLIGLVVIVQVPWDTTVRYDGRPSRPGFDMPLLVLAAMPALLASAAWRDRKRGKGLPLGEFCFVLAVLVGMVALQIGFAYFFFEAAAAAG